MTVDDKETRVEQRRQRRIDRRRGEIMEVAARIFAEKGYGNTTTREIAEAADIAEGTLYNYFTGKRDILLAIANESEAPMEAAVMAAGRITDRPSLVELAEKAIDIATSQEDYIKTIAAESWTDDYLMTEVIAIRIKRMHRRLTEFITAKIADGTCRQVDPALAAQMVMGLFSSFVLPTLRGVHPPYNPEQRRTIAEAIIDLVLDGIRA